LWRIAVEVQDAGVSELSATGQGWLANPALRGLSRRQSEILRRLIRGQRVSAIASELFVSQSTVRNHLSAIYRRFGVHSQAELLARLMPASE
jgi:DNA-binding NarL/FixJ family response regulator